jgi:hypothetical protein
VTDVMILKIFFAKKIDEKVGVSDSKTLLNYAKSGSYYWFARKPPFCSQKIGENRRQL